MYRFFFATCLLNGINPYKWLRYVLLHINSTAPVNYHTLLPCFIDRVSWTDRQPALARMLTGETRFQYANEV